MTAHPITTIVAAGRAHRVAHDIVEVRAIIANTPSVNGRQGVAHFRAVEDQPATVIDPYGYGSLADGWVSIDVGCIEAIS